MMVQLANEFAAQNLEVDLVLASMEGEYHAEISDRVRVVDLKSHRVLASLPGLVRYLLQAKPDVMLSTLGYANIVAAWAKKISRSKVRLFLREASTVNTEIMSFKGKAVIRLMSSAYQEAEGIVAISAGVKKTLLEYVAVEPHRIHVIYNPVIHDAMYALAKEPVEHPWFGAERPGKLIVAAGRLTAAKDYPTLIRAFARIQSDAKLVILGQGSERAMLEDLIRTLGLEARVSMPGFAKNPFAFMARADLFVLSSAWEGLGNVLIQAMALQVPVIATRCPGGPTEILEQGRWGRLVDVGDVQALAAAMEAALQQEEKTVYPGECLDRFDAKNIAGQYLGLMLPEFSYRAVAASV